MLMEYPYIDCAKKQRHFSIVIDVFAEVFIF